MTTRIVAAALAALLLCASAQAQDRAADAYPNKVVRAIVPYAPGGITDVLARLVAEGLSRSLGQQFIVENRPGGGTTIGTRAVVTAPPDGYTLLMGTTVLSINPHLMANLDYDAAKDLAPIANIGQSIGLIAVAGTTPVRTRWPSSSPGRSPSPASSPTAPPAPAASATSPANISTSSPAPNSPTSPIAAPRRS